MVKYLHADEAGHEGVEETGLGLGLGLGLGGGLLLAADLVRLGNDEIVRSKFSLRGMSTDLGSGSI
jgi:hypothetical protein